MTSTTAPPDSIPLNLLDELFLGLDHDEEPWTVHVEARVSGRLDPGRLAEAIQAAATRHPLARASLASWRWTDRGYRWAIADGLDAMPLQTVECADDAELAAAREKLMAESPSLRSAPPFDVLLAHGPDGDSLVLHVHHAAMDGIGAVRLMRSILCAYAGVEDPTGEVDPLAVRDVRALAGASSFGERMLRARALRRHSARQWVPPTRIAYDGATDRPGYGVDLHTLSVGDTSEIIAAAGADTTVNDLLLAALAVTIRRWNAEHGRPTGRIALSMPVNLRPQEWSKEVVGNFASYVTVSLNSADSADLLRALEVVSGQTRAIKSNGLGGIVVDLLVAPSMLTIASKRQLPHLIALTGDIVVDSAGLSNLGRLAELPALGEAGTVEALWFSPPARMPLGASLGALTLGGRLHLALRYRHSQFDPAGAGAFAALYRDVLTSTTPASNHEQDA